MRNAFVTLIWLPLTFSTSLAQNDSTDKTELNLSGFVDAFYSYDLNQPQTNFRQPFLYNHNRHNEINVNLALIEFNVLHAKYRGSVALQAGTYPSDNYAAEPVVFRSIYEANAGLSLNRKNNVWIDAGIFSSHIGFESAISMDNWTLTRSLLAENSPYYLAGAKLTFTPGTKWELAALVCNGWQRIKRVSGNSLLSVCSQIKFMPNKNVTLNWSTFSGTDDPDTTRRMRYFNNFYGQFQITKKIGLITGIDFGIQQRGKDSSGYNYWTTPVLIVRVTPSDKWAFALRGEYYQDETGITIATGTLNGFKTTGVSLNIDYAVHNNAMFRIEGRYFYSTDRIFTRANSLVNDNFFITASIAIKLGRAL
jgi:hypothetical protein